MKGKGGKGKGGKGGFGGRPSFDETPKSREEAARQAGPVKMYPDRPSLSKPPPFTEAQRSILNHCREMESRFRRSDLWEHANAAQRLGVTRWSDRFRTDQGHHFLKNFVPDERFFPASLCKTTPPTRKRARGEHAKTSGTSLEALEKLEAGGGTVEPEGPDTFSDDEEDDVDNEFEDDFEFDYEDDGEVGLGDADLDAEL